MLQNATNAPNSMSAMSRMATIFCHSLLARHVGLASADGAGVVADCRYGAVEALASGDISVRNPPEKPAAAP